MVMLYDVNVSSKSTLRVLCSGGLDITSGLLSTESCQLCSHALVHEQHTHIQETI